MRKLASIQKIIDILPIKNADRIEIATINGWKVVVGKDQFKVGDPCVYFEIDSVLPVDVFPELEKTNGRIKTIRLRDQISQGYCITFDRFKEIVEKTTDFWDTFVLWNFGDDVTKLLGIEKYEPPITFKNGECKGVFPSHILPKTDEDRIQSNTEYLDKMSSRPWVATIKYDGTSATFGQDNEEFFACSRNLSIRDGDNVYWNIVRKYKLQEVPSYFVVQGEICGPGIQKNHLGLKDISFFVFRVYDQKEKIYLRYDERIQFCMTYGLDHVELAVKSDNFGLTIEELLDLAKGKYDSGKHREGIVIEADEIVDTEYGGHLSFKIINNDFLTSGGD